MPKKKRREGRGERARKARLGEYHDIALFNKLSFLMPIIWITEHSGCMVLKLKKEKKEKKRWLIKNFYALNIYSELNLGKSAYF